jgi:ubiquitin C
MMHDKEDIPPPQQRLIFGEEVEEDGRTLSDYNIQPHAKLTIHFKLTVYVNMSTGKTLALELFDSETIQGLKMMVRRKEGIQEGWQFLQWAGTAREDDNILASYNMEKESTLHLIIEIHIRVETPAGECITLVCTTSDTIGDVMTRIAAEEYIPPDQQRIIILRRDT